MRNCRASDSAYSWSNVSPQRGLSVACRICTTDLDGVTGVQWHIVLDGVPDPSGNWRFEGRTARRPRQNVQFLYCSLTVSPMCHLANTEQTRSWVDFHSDSAFCQITLVPVTVTIDHFTSWSFLSFLCFNSSISLRCELNQLILLKCNCRIVTTWQTCSSLAYRDCFYTAITFVKVCPFTPPHKAPFTSLALVSVTHVLRDPIRRLSFFCSRSTAVWDFFDISFIGYAEFRPVISVVCFI